MSQGTIKKLIADKGFGFIRAGNTEFFFHHSSVADGAFDALQEGQSVEFDETDGQKGPRAENVRPA